MSNTTPTPPPGFVMQVDGRHSPAPPPGFVLQEQDDTVLPGPNVPNLPPPGARSGQEQFGYDPDSWMGGLRTAAGSFIEGIPVAGPYLRQGAEAATAGLRSAFSDSSYEEELARVQALRAAEKQANPYVDTGAQIAGSIAGTAPLIAAAPAAFGISSASVPARMLAAGSSGSALGAADGGVRGGVEGALIGGGIGAGLGLAGPLAGNLIGRGYEAFAISRANQLAARQAGTSREAVDVVSRGLSADNATGGQNRILAAGQQGMLADAGPATQAMLDAAIQRAGPGAGRATARIEARSNTSTQNINEALSTFLGQPQAVSATERGIRQGSAAARSSAYDAAYGAPIDYAAPLGRSIQEIVETRVPASAIRRANELMRVGGHQSKQILADIADDGTVTLKRLPDVRQLDYITRALNDVAEEANGQGALGGTTAIGRAYSDLSKELRDGLRELVPEYGKALQTAAEPISARNALRFGESLLRPQTTRDDVSQFVRGLSDPEKASLRLGVRAQIDETLANVRRTVMDGNVDARQGIAALRDLSSNAAREKMEVVLGEAPARALFGEIDRAAQSFELRGAVSRNSGTYGRQAAQRTVDELSGPGLLENVTNIRPQAALQSVASGVFNTGPESVLARQDKLWAQIADLLTQPANTAQGTLRKAVDDALSARPAIQSRAGLLDLVLSGGIAGGLAPPARTLLGTR